MIAVKVEKAKWNSLMSDWLLTNIEVGKYGFNRETLEPDYIYFEYYFIDQKDALVFTLTFNI